jgi:hypothetical protein
MDEIYIENKLNWIAVYGTSVAVPHLLSSDFVG